MRISRGYEQQAQIVIDNCPNCDREVRADYIIKNDMVKCYSCGTFIKLKTEVVDDEDEEPW